ncbi:helix-turn-helix domain-containing protein [Chryseobacterium sp. Hurlbut01]|uniref:helix-turn-helix domain-containing protein n=1 Tax=Chryseobacterium sp. Hurlbut01 TaxID=1681828 RepID=UPI000A92C36E|nr:helix-turn-helix domain-containing protein [Chryseobacterium sp. Hurlbut01]
MLVLIIESSGKTIKQFANSIEVSPETVARWLAGSVRPDLHNQERIRKEFKSEIAKLYK